MYEKQNKEETFSFFHSLFVRIDRSIFERGELNWEKGICFLLFLVCIKDKTERNGGILLPFVGKRGNSRVLICFV